MTNEKQDAIKELKKILKPGDTVYSIVRHVSASGMSRVISFYAIKKNQPRWLDMYIARACGFSFQTHNREGLKVRGCGMDMAFHVVYTLGATLWPKGNGKYKTGRNGDKGAETDGGYFLKKQSL
jgi:hypothetical protein